MEASLEPVADAPPAAGASLEAVDEPVPALEGGWQKKKIYKQNKFLNFLLFFNV